MRNIFIIILLLVSVDLSTQSSYELLKSYNNTIVSKQNNLSLINDSSEYFNSFLTIGLGIDYSNGYHYKNGFLTSLSIMIHSPFMHENFYINMGMDLFPNPGNTAYLSRSFFFIPSLGFNFFKNKLHLFAGAGFNVVYPVNLGYQYLFRSEYTLNKDFSVGIQLKYNKSFREGSINSDIPLYLINVNFSYIF